MRRLMLAAVLASALPVPALARLEPSPQRTLAGKVAGPARDCLQPFQRDQETKTFKSGDILYRGRGTTWYLNHPPGCPEFRSQMAIISDTPSQLCRGDIIRLVEPVSGTFYGSCALGDFTPYTDPSDK